MNCNTTHYRANSSSVPGDPTWKLASEGIPTVLIYLGFWGDRGIADAGRPFADDADWQSAIRKHIEKVCPPTVLDGPVDAGKAKFWVLSRSLKAQSNSPPKQPRAKRASPKSP